MMIDPSEIEARFPVRVERETPDIDRVRDACAALAHNLNHTLPEGREKSLALTAIQEAHLWAVNALDIDPTD